MWSHLDKSDANYTLVQVSVNTLVMIVAFAPIAGGFFWAAITRVLIALCNG